MLASSAPTDAIQSEIALLPILSIADISSLYFLAQRRRFSIIPELDHTRANGAVLLASVGPSFHTVQ